MASAKAPEAAIRTGLKSRGEEYKSNPQALVSDLRSIKRDYENLVSLLGGNVQKKWGKNEVKLPSQTSYIKYTQNYKSRTIVDFDSGTITVETVDDTDAQASLKSAIITTLLTPDDPQAVDLFTDKPITLTSEKPPYLLKLVQDHQGKPVATPAQAGQFAQHLLDKQASTREVVIQNGSKKALFVKIAMVANFENKQAEKYLPLVNRLAKEHKVSTSLVFAMIRAESNFNPFAVSSAPAYGMMQLVPSSGGREACRRVKGVDEMPTKEYLFDAEKNIELGVAYLGVLYYQQLNFVANHTAREYCVISAYNTGPSNVLRAFAADDSKKRDRVAAINRINGMEPPGVFEQLRLKLPYEETRHYIVKVVNYRKQYVSFAN
ncbi:MAG: murein transglycosylase domain-containing protein [Methylotenera sp.]